LISSGIKFQKGKHIILEYMKNENPTTWLRPGSRRRKRGRLKTKDFFAFYPQKLLF
jgi:hypothetical protein